ncbi:MAG: trigger factor [Fimbriimonadaceae bacterium]|nr:trigger factor [Fimbriimonadaceae bacterium]
MDVRHERDASGMTSIRIDVPTAVVDEVYAATVRELKRQITVPGFRRGKVPPKMVESIIGREQILDYAKERLQERVYPEAMAELPTLVTLDEPDLQLERFVKGEPCELTVKVLTALVDLGEWEGRAVEQADPPVPADELEAAWTRFCRENREQLEADHTDARTGDVVSFMLRIVRDGFLMEEYGEDDPLQVELGNNSLNPNIDEHLVGLAVGQPATFAVTYPEDYGNDELKGQTVEFTVTLTELLAAEQPAAMLQRLGSDGDIDAAKRRLADSLQSQRRSMARIYAREDAVRQALEGARIDIPRAHLEAEIMEEIEEYEEGLTARGVELDGDDQAAIAHEEQHIRERVEFDTRREVFLRALAQKEQVELQPEDIANEVSMLSMYNRVEARLLMRRLEENGELPRIARAARIRKAAELVFEKATVTVVEKPLPVQGGHDHEHLHHDEEGAAVDEGAPAENE